MAFGHNRSNGKSMDDRVTAGPAKSAASMAALIPLVRYGRRYLGRAIAALAALTVSSAATLAVPFALRSMIDFGFSKESGGAIDVLPGHGRAGDRHRAGGGHPLLSGDRA